MVLISFANCPYFQQSRVLRKPCQPKILDAFKGSSDGNVAEKSVFFSKIFETLGSMKGNMRIFMVVQNCGHWSCLNKNHSMF